MWVLVFWLCTNYNCSTTIVPGYYESESGCTVAKDLIVNEDSVLVAGVPQASCIPAPENAGFE